MSKTYMALIMDKHYIGDGMFVFNCNHAVTGKIDEKTNILTDNHGNEYTTITDSSLLRSELPSGYFNPIDLSEITEKMSNQKRLSLGEAITEYEKESRRVVYLVGLIDGQVPFCMPIEIGNIKEEVKKQLILELTRDDEKVNENSSEKTIDLELGTAKNDDLENLIIDIIKGKFTDKQLKILRGQAENELQMVESLVETINLQLADREIDVEEIVKQAQEIKEEVDKQNISEPVEKKEKPKEEKNNCPINIEDLFKKVTKTLIAQDEAARRVIVEIARKEMDDRKKKEGILLTGATGVGKTELMRLIAKHLNRPFYKVDSTQLTIPGYVGKDIEEVLWDLYESCGRDIDKTEHAIIFFDEIDKKGSKKKDDVSGKGVLNLLLSFIEGTTYDATENTKSGSTSRKVKIDTSKMTVILGGAFTDVYKNLAEKNGVGFGSIVTSEKRNRPATVDDFVEKAMMTDEFMGRVTVVKLNDLDVDSIKRVLLESDQSALKVQEEIFKKLGVKITFTDGYTTEIAKRAEKKKTGARGLNAIIDETTWKAFDEICCHNGEYDEVILDENTVENPESFQLVKRKNNN